MPLVLCPRKRLCAMVQWAESRKVEVVWEGVDGAGVGVWFLRELGSCQCTLPVNMTDEMRLCSDGPCMVWFLFLGDCEVFPCTATGHN
jgi:hypothetical protein